MITKKDIFKLESLLYLLSVSQHNSKREASEIMGTSLDTINKYINNLERYVGAKLIASNGRGSILSPEAEKYINLGNDLKRIISMVDFYASEKDNVSGIVRFGIMEGINYSICPLNIMDFYAQYPFLQLEITTYDAIPNLNIFEADIALTYHVPQGCDLVILDTRRAKCGLYASALYIERFGMPKDINDMLENHPLCVKFTQNNYIEGWKEITKKAKRVAVRANTTHSLIAQISSGAGIGVIPVNSAPENLVKIKTVDFEPVYNYYLTVHKETKDTPRIRAFIDYLRQSMS